MHVFNGGPANASQRSQEYPADSQPRVELIGLAEYRRILKGGVTESVLSPKLDWPTIGTL